MADCIHFDLRASAWTLRHHDCCKPGMWIVTIFCALGGESSIAVNFNAVVDDFGNLVVVR